MWELVLSQPIEPKPRSFGVADGSLKIESLGKRFGGVEVFKELSFELHRGEILGVIGPNGAGKTTLINVICGMLSPSSGTISLNGEGTAGLGFHQMCRRGVVRSFQHTNTFRSETVRENLLRSIAFSGQSMNAWDDAQELLEDFGLAGNLDERGDALPYGAQKMLGLLMAYLTRPKILLLDEPAAGLERSERAWIDRFVDHATGHLGCGLLIVEHDMALVKRLCPKSIVLDAGRMLAHGPTREVLSREDVIAAYVGAEEEVEP